MSTPVWIQLYYEGDDNPMGDSVPLALEKVPFGNIGGLIKATKEELKKELDHAGHTEMVVYPPGTQPRLAQGNSIKPGKKLAELIEELKDETPPTSDDYPLIVVAPAPAPHPQGQGKQLSCSRSPWNGRISENSHLFGFFSFVYC